MPDMPVEAAAKLALLTQLVRLMMRENAIAAKKTPEDVLAYGEVCRQFIEKNMPPGIPEMPMNAAITEFFNVLARDLKTR